MSTTPFANVLRFFNEATGPEDLKSLKVPADLAAAILARKKASGGMFTSVDQLSSIAKPDADLLGQLSDTIDKLPFTDVKLEAERENFKSLILENPNYFGNLEGSIFQPVKPIKANPSYEELACVGLQTQLDRLEAVIRIKKNAGYGGTICQPGSFEFVRFFVDLHDNGIFTDVGLTSVNVHDIPGAKPLCYAAYLDFAPIRKLCIFDNVVRVRAILSWNAVPPSNPNFVPVWGGVLDAEIQIRPRSFLLLSDVVQQITEAKVKLPDPIGPVISALNPETKLTAAAPQALSLEEKRKIYQRAEIPVHRYAFSELQPLLEANAAPEVFASVKTSPLLQLGLSAAEISGLLGKLQLKTDGDTSFEQLNCVGARPANDVLEGVLTVKKPNGYSGKLCSQGSTEYVAFWADFNDGTGFNYLGTTSVNVHDLSKIPNGGVQYGVFLKTNFAKWRVPCQFGARIARLRAILSWEAAPPPANPNYVPVWGNRLDCLIQIRPGTGVGHVPLIETIGDVPVNHIDQGAGLLTRGRATGHLEIASASVNVSPFGGDVTITGEIGLPPNVLGSAAQPFKYRIQVKKEDGVDTYHPLLNDVDVSYAIWNGGIPQFCDFFFDFVCQANLHPTNDSDGLGDGWYPYLEDTTPPNTRHLVTSKLGTWHTNAGMEGPWRIRIDAKDPNTTPPTFYPGIQDVLVRIDNTPPVPDLHITGATFNGGSIAAVDCGKFPVGTILNGTYSAHDPGAVSLAAEFQHFGSLSFDVEPTGPAHGATVNPSGRSYPVVPTTGENGTWTLNTAGMDPCGYIIRMVVCDRTNVGSTGNAYCVPAEVGFCLENPSQ